METVQPSVLKIQNIVLNFMTTVKSVQSVASVFNRLLKTYCWRTNKLGIGFIAKNLKNLLFTSTRNGYTIISANIPREVMKAKIRSKAWSANSPLVFWERTTIGSRPGKGNISYLSNAVFARIIHIRKYKMSTWKRTRWRYGWSGLS